jgi:hypothetical protein
VLEEDDFARNKIASTDAIFKNTLNSLHYHYDNHENPSDAKRFIDYVYSGDINVIISQMDWSCYCFIELIKGIL